MRSFRRTLIAILVVALASWFAGAAGAVTAPDESTGLTVGGTDFSLDVSSGTYNAASATTTVTGVVSNWSGEDAPANDPLGKTTIVGASVSNAQVATAGMIGADNATFSSPSSTSLAAAALTSIIWVKTWSQWNCSHLSCAAWKKTQSGRVYYNGTTTWTKTRSGFTGFHSCTGWSAAGYSVDFTSCTNQGSDPASASTSPNHQHLQDDYVIHLLFKGFPLSNSLWQYANVYPSGSIFFHWKVK